MSRIPWLLALLPWPLHAELTQSTDPDTQLTGWKLASNHFELDIIQRLPDQTRAFFQARGFSNPITEHIATHCVFQTMAKNTATQPNAAPITIKLKDWQIKLQGKIQPIKLKEDWLSEWEKNKNISKPAKLAFRWATLPTEQTYEPGGDYNWGMVSFGPSPGETFDLKVSWQIGQENHSTWIKSIQCPTDR